MATDFTPYTIIPTEVSDKIVSALRLARELVFQHARHKVKDIDFVLSRMWETAKTFEGSQNIPTNAKKACEQ